MVLFLEPETLRLLDLYAALRADPSNVTNNGVLLKQQAREQLTTSLNESFPREAPWTESQVAVKFKNLRSEYAEFKWLSSQPGFQADGAALSDEWWAAIKARRPKCHAFKGKLPWVFEARMKQIVGDSCPRQRNAKMKKQPTEEEEATTAAATTEEERHEEGADQTTVVYVEPLSESVPPSVPPVPPPYKRKRSDDASGDASRDQEQEQDRTAPVIYDTGGEYSYSRSLARSVEQSSVAAAGMARGFQDLITMFQEQSAKCGALEQQLTHRSTEALSLALAEQRSVLLAMARSLEQSTRATADMAQGYRDLVKAFVRATDVTRQQQQQQQEREC